MLLEVRSLVVMLFVLAACGTSVDLGGTGGADSGPTQCGNEVAPSVDATCNACDKTSADCQPNGCYGGYWCDTLGNHCEPPPKTCQ